MEPGYKTCWPSNDACSHLMFRLESKRRRRNKKKVPLKNKQRTEVDRGLEERALSIQNWKGPPPKGHITPPPASRGTSTRLHQGPWPCVAKELLFGSTPAPPLCCTLTPPERNLKMAPSLGDRLAGKRQETLWTHPRKAPASNPHNFSSGWPTRVLNRIDD